MKKIVVIGLGYVGLVTSLVFAEANFEVLCIDKDDEKIKLLKNKRMPFYEKGCDELLEKNYEKMTFTSEYEEIYKEKIFFICVGTPLNSYNSLDINSIKEVIKNIDNYAKNKELITVCIRSTILPNTCNELKKHIKNSNIRLAHNPEFLSQGNALKDFIHAKRVVIGSDDNYSLHVIKDMYKKLSNSYKVKVPIITMSTSEAEMVKFMANSYLAMRLSFVNEMSNLCEKLNIDLSKVIDGVKYDERIGNKYFKNGIGYGGSCLPKDTKAILKFSQENGVPLKLVKSTIEVNDLQLKKSLKVILHDFPDLKNKKVAILGVAFKSNTDDIRNSCSLYLTNELLKRKAIIRVYDPIALKSFQKLYGNKIDYYNDIEKCIVDCDIIVIATDWKIIREFDFGCIKFDKKIFLYDFKSCLSKKNKLNKNIKYWFLGGKNNEK